MAVRVKAERPGSLGVSNFPQFIKYLEDGLHVVKQGENTETLLKHNAHFNNENLPFSWKTCFVKPVENEDGSVYTPIEEDELLPLLEKAVVSGQKFPQDDGRIQAVYLFQR